MDKNAEEKSIDETDMVEIFTNIYENLNGEGLNISSGSNLNYNNEYILFVKEFIKNNNINVVVDLGCGDFEIGIELYKELNVMYNGIDVYKKQIDYHNSITKKLSSFWSFDNFDFYNEKEKIPFGDLCIIKDVFQHWNYNLTYNFLNYLTQSKKFKYILICNCSYQIEDQQNISTGVFRPINNNFYPLNKFKLIKVFSYNTKDVYLYENK
jgi:hypothetical protein